MSQPRRWAPSIPAMTFALWWIVASIVFPDRLLNADGDLLRHIGHGEWMLRHHALIHHDPFSFTMQGQPFVGFEYGSQLIFALVHRAAGLAGIAIFAGLLIGTAYALLARFLLSRGTDPLLTYIVTVAAVVLGAPHWVARPHLFTLLLVVFLLPMLEVAGRGSRVADDGSPGPRPEARDPRPIWAVPLFALWANLHGGFVFGLALIAIYFAGHGLEYLAGNDRPFRREEMQRLAKFLLAGLLGTLLNPNFLQLHEHLIRFFGQSFLAESTEEFLSPDFHMLSGRLLLLALLAIVAAFALSRRRPDGPRLLLVLAMIWATLMARRNMQLFSVTAVPVMALWLDPDWRRLPDWRGIRSVFQRDAPLGMAAPYVLLMLALFGFLAVGRGRVAGAQVIPDGVSPTVFPVDVVRRARAEHVNGRLFHNFIWGGYLIYAWPEQKVFIDGGTDFYGPGLVKTWLGINGLAPHWRDSLSRWDISLALLPPDSPLARELLRQPGWQLRDCDATAVLLQKTGPAGPQVAADSLLDQCDRTAGQR
jgi:hypothetical protein